MTNKELNRWNQEAEERLIKACEHLGCKDGCPYVTNSGSCSLKKDALDLINSLKAEIGKNEKIIKAADGLIETQKAEKSNLEIELKAMRGAANSYKAEIERLKKGWKADVIETENIKAEAVKEFADLAIKNICERVSAPTPSESYIVERCNQVIDETYAEMVGEDK